MKKAPFIKEVLRMVVTVIFLSSCTGTTPDNNTVCKLKLTGLHNAADQIGKNNPAAGEQLNQLAVDVAKSIAAGNEATASADLNRYSYTVFTQDSAKVPLDARLNAMEAVVQTQNVLGLPDSTQLHTDFCCKRTGPNKGVCQEFKGGKCYTINSIPDGCLGTPCN